MSEKNLNLSSFSFYLVTIENLPFKFLNLKSIALSMKSLFLQECGHHQTQNENLSLFNPDQFMIKIFSN